MLKNYELLYILHPDLEGSSDKVNEKVAGFITKAGGEVTSHEDWGKRKLAYKIAKNDFGVYILDNFALPSENLPQIERDLRLSEEIMRFMIVTIPEEKERSKKPSKKDKAKAEKKEETAPVEVVVEEKTEEPKAKKVTKKAAEKKEEVVTEEKPKKATKKATEKKADKEPKKEETEKERMKKLDEKLEEILGE